MTKSDLIDAVVLDLFAGSGAGGIEALSRGAARAVFVEHDQNAARTVAEHLAQPLQRVARGRLRQADPQRGPADVDRERIVRFIFRLVPPAYDDEAHLLEHSVSKSFGGFLRGQALLGLIYGVISMIASTVLGLPYTPVTATSSGILQAIPFFGPFISWAPPVLVAVFFKPEAALPVLIIMIAGWFVLMNIIQPRLMADAVGLHPVVVLGSPSYNPHGLDAPTAYRFPFPDGTFDFILLTSVFTHMLEDEMRNYLSEAARLLLPGGRVYATFFLCQDFDEIRNGIQRHGGIAFHYRVRSAAVSREDYPTHAVAYREEFVRDSARGCGLLVAEPTRYGLQDVLIFEKERTTSIPELGVASA